MISATYICCGICRGANMTQSYAMRCHMKTTDLRHGCGPGSAAINCTISVLQDYRVCICALR